MYFTFYYETGMKHERKRENALLIAVKSFLMVQKIMSWYTYTNANDHSSKEVLLSSVFMLQEAHCSGCML